jgi:hypothetical protein
MDRKILYLIMQEIKIKCIYFLYLECEQKVFGVKQLQRKNWVIQPKKKMVHEGQTTHEGIVHMG